MQNRLVVLGCLGIKKAYLNVSLEEARRRYAEQTGEDPDDHEAKVIEFDDQFEVYDAWATGD